MLGTEIRRRRKALGWSQEKLAEKAGLTPHYLSTVECDRRDPSVSTVEAVAKALGVSAADLLGGVDGLTPAGVEAARLFQRLPKDGQDLVLRLMRQLGRRT